LNNPITRLVHARIPRQENLSGCLCDDMDARGSVIDHDQASNTALLMQNFPRAGAAYGPELD